MWSHRCHHWLREQRRRVALRRCSPAQDGRPAKRQRLKHRAVTPLAQLLERPFGAARTCQWRCMRLHLSTRPLPRARQIASANQFDPSVRSSRFQASRCGVNAQDAGAVEKVPEARPQLRRPVSGATWSPTPRTALRTPRCRLRLAPSRRTHSERGSRARAARGRGTERGIAEFAPCSVLRR